MLTIRCRNCRFWKAGYGDRGECRRFPRATNGSGWYFAPAEASDWCGEHEPRLDTTATEGADSTPAPRGP